MTALGFAGPRSLETIHRRISAAALAPLVYVAGPMLSCGNPYRNVQLAVQQGQLLRERGYQPMLPQLHALWDMASSSPIDVETWLTWDFNLISRCNAVLFQEDSEHSSGCRDEAAYLAVKHPDMPVYRSVGEMPPAADFWGPL